MKKSWSESLWFQRGPLIAITVVWAIRLGLSLAGRVRRRRPLCEHFRGRADGCVLYYPWALWRTGFGAFKQLYRLCLVQGVFSADAGGERRS
jgi:hypothetical protein